MLKNRSETEALKKPGIYIIQDLTKGKVYIGSSVNIHSRLNEHVRSLKKNNHYNYFLQNAYNKKHNLKEILITTEPSVNIREVEQKLLDEFIDQNVLYNVSRDATSGMGGRKHSEETKQMMSLTRTGTKHSEEWNLNISKGQIGKVMSDAFKEKCRQNSLGKKLSIETKEKLSLSHLGKKASDEAKLNMSLARKGVPLSKENAEKARVNVLKLIKRFPIIVDNVQYSSILEASKKTNISYSILYNQFNKEKL